MPSNTIIEMTLCVVWFYSSSAIMTALLCALENSCSFCKLSVLLLGWSWNDSSPIGPGYTPPAPSSAVPTSLCSGHTDLSSAHRHVTLCPAPGPLPVLSSLPLSSSPTCSAWMYSLHFSISHVTLWKQRVYLFSCFLWITLRIWAP